MSLITGLDGTKHYCTQDDLKKVDEWCEKNKKNRQDWLEAGAKPPAEAKAAAKMPLPPPLHAETKKSK